MSTRRRDTPLSSPTSGPSVDTFVQPSTTTSPTSLSPSADSNRWSDLIPPKTALTFAVLWDPEQDFVAFSGAQLLDANGADDDLLSPSEAFDDQAYSQILTIDPSAPFLESENSTAMLAFYRENHALFLSSQVNTPTPDRLQPGMCRTQTSSTLDGLDVYLRGSMMGRAHSHHRHYSCMENLDSDFQFDPRTSFAKCWSRTELDYEYESDEGFFETGVMMQNSSVRGAGQSGDRQCTSKGDSQFVPVRLDDDGSSEWSTVETPDSPPLRGLLYGDQERPRTPRRLKKRRPNEIPVPPLVVLRRQCYGHDIPPPPNPPSSPGNKTMSTPSLPSVIPKIAARLKRHRRSSDSWVCVEITQTITQYEIL